MVNAVGGSIASGSEGNLQVVKKVVTTVGRFGDYTAEIQQSYELGFTPYRLHMNYFFMHFCPGTMTTHAESIKSDLQRGLDR